MASMWQQSLPYQDAAGTVAFNAWVPGLGTAIQPMSQDFWDWYYEGEGGVDWKTGPGAAQGGAGSAWPTLDPNLQNQAQVDRFAFGDYLAQAAAADAGLRGQQSAFLDTLTARAEGRGGPSLAEMQLQQSLAQNQANAAGFMGSQRGLNPALAARTVGNQQAAMAQSAAGQGAMLRAQEQAAAQAMLGQALQGFRGQEQSMFGGAAAGMQNQNDLSARIGAGNRDAEIAYAQLLSQDATRREEAAARRREEERGILGNVTDSAAKVLQAKSMMGGGGASSGSGFDHGGIDPYDYSLFEADGMSEGGKVPGRAEVAGDSEENDDVLAWLSPGELVIPRSVVQTGDPAAIAAFAEACLTGVKPEQAKKYADGGRVGPPTREDVDESDNLENYLSRFGNAEDRRVRAAQDKRAFADETDEARQDNRSYGDMLTNAKHDRRNNRRRK